MKANRIIQGYTQTSDNSAYCILEVVEPTVIPVIPITSTDFFKRKLTTQELELVPLVF